MSTKIVKIDFLSVSLGCLGVPFDTFCITIDVLLCCKRMLFAL